MPTLEGKVALCVVCLMTIIPGMILDSANYVNTDTTDTTPTTAPLVFRLAKKWISDQSITLEWSRSLAEEVGVHWFNISIRDRKDESGITVNITVTGDVSEYELKDLKSNTEYEICISATFDNATVYENVTECELFKTDEHRSYLLIIIIIIIVLILILIILAIICCFIAQRKQRRTKVSKDPERKPVDERVTAKPTSQVNAPPPKTPAGRPVGYDDDTIPFMTPPVDQLSKNEKNDYIAAQKKGKDKKAAEPLISGR